MNCRECKYKEDQPRTHHIACRHPKVYSTSIEDLLNLLRGDYTTFQVFSNKLDITINRHGFEHGWASFPILYDPIWIEGCTGFEATDEKEALP